MLVTQILDAVDHDRLSVYTDPQLDEAIDLLQEALRTSRKQVHGYPQTNFPAEILNDIRKYEAAISKISQEALRRDPDYHAAAGAMDPYGSLF